VDERRLIIERFARLNSIALIDTDTGDRQSCSRAPNGRSAIHGCPRIELDRVRCLASAWTATVRAVPFREQPIPESEWVVVDRFASHPFWSADGRFLLHACRHNPLIRSAVRARHFVPASVWRKANRLVVRHLKC
jgi:hypothetical protein